MIDAAPKILIVDDDDVERMMAQEAMQRDHFEGGIVSKISDRLVMVTFFAVGVLLLPIFFLVYLVPIGKCRDKFPNCT